MATLWLPFGLGPKRKETGVRYGDLYSRGIAAAIDLTLLFLLLNDFFRYVGGYIFARMDASYLPRISQAPTLGRMLVLLWQSRLIELWLLNALFQMCILGIAFVCAQVIWGTTLGKWLLGLRVVRVKTFAPLSPWRYALRFVAYIPAALPLMIGIFWVSFNRERRGWHDYIAGTVVLNLRPDGWYWEQVKKGYRRLRGRSVAAVENPVGEPPAE